MKTPEYFEQILQWMLARYVREPELRERIVKSTFVYINSLDTDAPHERLTRDIVEFLGGSIVSAHGLNTPGTSLSSVRADVSNFARRVLREAIE